MFPLDDLPPRSTEVTHDDSNAAERVRDVQGSLTRKRPISKEDAQQIASVNRPGSFYKHYRTVDQLPPAAIAFFERSGMGCTRSIVKGHILTV